MSKVHMMGIGGVGMAALAVLLKSRGDEVSGCDLKPTPRTRWLESQGIPVAFGHDPQHVTDADVVIVTPAVHADNPERIAAGNRVRFRGEVLAEIVNCAADSIVVCGSHGKTTTATYIAKLLRALGERVSWAIGGETGSFPVGHADAGVLVVEGDESDGTLMRYHAKTLVITNVEYDHPDHFPTPADYEACFEQARRQANLVVEGCADNESAAIEVALGRGYRREDAERAMQAIVSELPDRRFQRLTDGVCADYAHHPTEIRYTLDKARRQCRGRLIALFQPHRYSRTKALKVQFAAALALADEVVLCPTYSAFEAPVEGGDVADLYLACRQAGVRVKLSRSCLEAWEHARNSRSAEDMVMLLGAGDIIDLTEHLNDEFPMRKFWIGAGSNTWKSDLRLNVEYVKTDHPAGRAGAELGIAWMIGIPGTLGGWVKMNAGAFGHSISEVIAAVKVDGKWLSAAECGFGYRTSSIAGEIQDVRFDDAALAEARRGDAQAYLVRRRCFPAGTFGSVFKNPAGDFAGRLLEAAGAKELRVGGAYVWQDHANVIVRGEGATPSDVLALSRLMAQKVYFRFNIALVPEVQGL